MSQVDMPKQLGHVNGVAYAAISLLLARKVAHFGFGSVLAAFSGARRADSFPHGFQRHSGSSEIPGSASARLPFAAR